MFCAENLRKARDETANLLHIRNICDVFGIAEDRVDITADRIEASVREPPSEYQHKFIRSCGATAAPPCELTGARIVKFPFIRTVDWAAVALDRAIQLAAMALMGSIGGYAVKFYFD